MTGAPTVAIPIPLLLATGKDYCRTEDIFPEDYPFFHSNLFAFPMVPGADLMGTGYPIFGAWYFPLGTVAHFFVRHHPLFILVLFFNLSPHF